MLEFDLATRDDIEDMVGLLQLLFALEEEMRPDPATQRRGLQSIIESPGVGQLFVVRQTGLIVGMVNLQFGISTLLGAPSAWLEDVVVEPAHRGGGAGSLLVEGALNFARDRGFARASLVTDAQNEGAQRFYARHGFEQSSMTLWRRPL